MTSARTEQEAESEVILESVVDGLIVYGPGGEIRRINGRARLLLSLTPEVERKSLVERLAAEGLLDTNGAAYTPERAPAFRALHGETVHNELLCVATAQGERRWLRFNASPLLGPDGAITGAVATFDDVTYEHHLEEELRASHQRYRALIEYSLDAVFLTRLDGTIEAANPAACDLIELPKEARSADGTSAVIDPNSEAAAALRRREGRGSRGELFIRRKDGTTIVCDTNLVHFANEGSLRSMVVARDISERKRAEQALAESEERFRQLADSMPQLVWTARPDGTVDYYNQRAFEFAGIERRPDGSWGWEPVIHPDDAQATLDAWTQAVSHGSKYEMAHRIRRKDGSFRWYLSRGLPVRDASGRVVRWYGTATDIHWQKQAELELIEADQLKNRALASVSHELRNPLAAIRTALHVLTRHAPADASARRALEIVDRQSKQMSRIVGDLLDVSRISQSKFHLQLERLELGELVRRTVEDYRPLFGEAGIDLEVQVDPTPLFARGDGTRLAQALGNVLNNAAKFTPRGGKVSVHVGAEAGFAVARVSDNGMGIAPEALERIFEQFTQADETLERKRSGLGLGLSLVKGILELHGGQVSAHSEGLGRGSEFILRVPLEPAAQAEAQPPA